MKCSGCLKRSREVFEVMEKVARTGKPETIECGACGATIIEKNETADCNVLHNRTIVTNGGDPNLCPSSTPFN